MPRQLLFFVFLIEIFFGFAIEAKSFALDSDGILGLTEQALVPQKALSVNDQTAAYDDLYSHYNIVSKDDAFSKKIREYFAIAKRGIEYVQADYVVDTTTIVGITVVDRCNRLHGELVARVRETGGLSPVEFILFNLKLALSQAVYPHGHPIELDYDVKRILNAGHWKTKPFYESHEVYDLGGQQYGPPIPLIKNLFSEGYVPKPYIIYNTKGSFRTSRIVTQLLKVDGKHRNLSALPKGTVAIENSAHGIYNRDPYSFLVHDLMHGKICYRMLSMPENQKFLEWLGPVSAERLTNLVIPTFLLLLIHEGLFYPFDSSQTFTTIDDFLDACERRVNKSKSSSYKALLDPFAQVVSGMLGDDIGYNGINTTTEPQVVADPDAYVHTCTINVDNQRSTFRYEIKRTGKKDGTGLYEYVQVLSINHAPAEDANPLDVALIEKVKASVGQNFLALTKESEASTDDSLIKLMYKTLGKNPSDLSTITPQERRVHREDMVLEVLQKFREIVSSTA